MITMSDDKELEKQVNQALKKIDATIGSNQAIDQLVSMGEKAVPLLANILDGLQETSIGPKTKMVNIIKVLTKIASAPAINTVAFKLLELQLAHRLDSSWDQLWLSPQILEGIDPTAKQRVSNVFVDMLPGADARVAAAAFLLAYQINGTAIGPSIMPYAKKLKALLWTHPTPLYKCCENAGEEGIKFLVGEASNPTTHFESRSGTEYSSAEDALRNVGSPAIPYLMELLKSDNIDHKIVALETLLEIYKDAKNKSLP